MSAPELQKTVVTAAVKHFSEVPLQLCNAEELLFRLAV